MEIITELNLEQLIIKGRSKNVSEIWYRKDNGAIIKPIFQTPRLKVAYGAKKYQSNSTYSYCVSLHNYDIDEEIACFYNLIMVIDEHIRTTLTAYKSAMFQKNTDFLMRFKLIGDDTLITDTRGQRCTPDTLVYGVYTDQFVGLDVLIYTNEGVIPLWNAHQIVISPVEKIFLSTCLLDTLGMKPEEKVIPIKREKPCLEREEIIPSVPAHATIRKSPLGIISLDAIQGKLSEFKLKKSSK